MWLPCRRQGTLDAVRRRLAPIRGIPTKKGGMKDPDAVRSSFVAEECWVVGRVLLSLPLRLSTMKWSATPCDRLVCTVFAGSS